jgi:hypothetical protein
MISDQVIVAKTVKSYPEIPFQKRKGSWIFLIFALIFCDFSLTAQTTNALGQSVGLQASTNSNGNGNSGGSGDNNGKAKGKNKPKVSERPQVIGAKGTISDSGKGKPANPGNPNSTDPAEVTTLVNKFQSAREQYIAAQKEVRLKMKDATEDQRAALREQLKDLLDKWKEEQKQFVEETKDRVKDMKQELQPDLGKVVDGAGGEGNGGRGR